MYTIEEVQRQILLVPEDFCNVSRAAAAARPLGVGKVWVTGSGDSRAAALDACYRAPSHRFTQVVFPWELSQGDVVPESQDIVIFISASGESDNIVDSASVLQGRCATIAITGRSRCRLSAIVERSVVWRLGDPIAAKSPAIRTYAASYITLLSLLEVLRDSANQASVLTEQLIKFCEHLRALSHWVVEDPIAGPTYLSSPQFQGAAIFARAKSLEISGVIATATDFGEWFHVDRHGAPPHGPIIAFAGSGILREHERLAIEAAVAQGRRVLIVGPAAVRHDGFVQLAFGDLPEFAWPLACGLVGAAVGARQAELLGRRPFSFTH